MPNETLLNPISINDINPMLAQQYVLIDECKEYAADLARNNYILAGVLALVGIILLIYAYRKEIVERVPFFTAVKNNMIMLRAQAETGKSIKQAVKEGIKNGRGNIPESHDRHDSPTVDNDDGAVQHGRQPSRPGQQGN